ncbi:MULTISPECIES: cytochrome c oxidase subunit II [Mameliella]|jgi:cytochrome c oxidase subunit 2|uniref:Cytochrome c oxidase subunit 2 n=2 Tax=Roseobacteraceae TaxID=2854170 RepID=A0A0B3SCU2_9RHOB|nr:MULTISPECIES: cytochrome c oxidase subunit II [Mameliella]MCR9273431.1 cytochrome c oxidase subunit II [Paracoccaceae bacterium]MDD9731158.1 cytochrome c oxidase subunit II [Mameliella sp. AT18]ODM49055.1 cytochrome c oxidase subunit II [Ruegeria sp. PBVC088]KHQ54516.1 cytochrome c oxidase subunit 2 [Mameliella alba]MBY6118328.1 cytochrome c oxidase subunit II [Mameliella alba]
MQSKPMLLGLLSAFIAAPALAQDLPVVGKPHDGGMGFQPAATELAADLQWLDGMILVIITAICLLVVALMAFIYVRFNRKANPNPSSFTHNSPLEVAWTIGPIVILVFIGAFSLPVLFKQQEIPEGDITIKVTGYQWYWGYEYVGTDLIYDAYMIGSPATGGDNRMTPAVEEQLVDAGYEKSDFLLATDTAIVLPVGKTVVMQVTGADVIHSWTIPAFGVKQDAVPGRLAELWFTPEKEGVYYGQCSELCGIAHAYMPITVKVVSEEAYEAWLQRSIDEGGYTDVREVLTN